jgi:hypothetical protein
MNITTIPVSAYACIGVIAVVISYVAISETAKDTTESSSYTSMLPNVISQSTSNEPAPPATASEPSAPPIFTGGRKKTKRRNKKHKHKKSGKHHSKHR